MTMRYQEVQDVVEVVDSVVADVVALLGAQDEAVLAQLRQLFAQGAVRVAEFEAELQADGAPFGVADELAEYLEQ